MANPLAFVPGLAMCDPDTSSSARGNPDPFAFGAARPSAAQLEAQLAAQLTEFSDKIYKVREDEQQDDVHLYVQTELKKMIGACKYQDVPVPDRALDALHHLDVALVSPLLRHSLSSLFAPASQYACLPELVWQTASVLQWQHIYSFVSYSPCQSKFAKNLRLRMPYPAQGIAMSSVSCCHSHMCRTQATHHVCDSISVFQHWQS